MKVKCENKKKDESNVLHEDLIAKKDVSST